MDDPHYLFYECENQNCGLRFPGYEGALRGNRCPICRSNTHMVAFVESTTDKTSHEGIQSTWRVDALLDNIRSAWNVGAIFRTADGTGIHKIYLCGVTPTPENSKVRKTSLHAEENIPWEHSKNGVNTAVKLKSQGHLLWALEDLPDSVPLFQVDVSDLNSPLVLIVGNEVCGVDPGLLEVCDQVISIPMLGKKQSYNVAIAFSIAVSFLLYRHSVSQGSFNILPSI